MERISQHSARAILSFHITLSIKMNRIVPAVSLSKWTCFFGVLRQRHSFIMASSKSKLLTMSCGKFCQYLNFSPHDNLHPLLPVLVRVIPPPPLLPFPSVSCSSAPPHSHQRCSASLPFRRRLRGRASCIGAGEPRRRKRGREASASAAGRVQGHFNPLPLQARL